MQQKLLINIDFARAVYMHACGGGRRYRERDDGADSTTTTAAADAAATTIIIMMLNIYVRCSVHVCGVVIQPTRDAMSSSSMSSSSSKPVTS